MSSKSCKTCCIRAIPLAREAPRITIDYYDIRPADPAVREIQFIEKEDVSLPSLEIVDAEIVEPLSWREIIDGAAWRVAIWPIVAGDALLLRLAGEEHTLLHNFFRVVVVGAVLAVVPLAYVASGTLGEKTLVAVPSDNQSPTTRTGDTLKNSIGMKLVRIPAGKFVMGSPVNEWTRGNNEQQHEVTITNAFYLGTYEVTQAEFEKVMGKNPSSFSLRGDRKEDVAELDTAPSQWKR